MSAHERLRQRLNAGRPVRRRDLALALLEAPCRVEEHESRVTGATLFRTYEKRLAWLLSGQTTDTPDPEFLLDVEELCDALRDRPTAQCVFWRIVAESRTPLALFGLVNEEGLLGALAYDASEVLESG